MWEGGRSLDCVCKLLCALLIKNHGADVALGGVCPELELQLPEGGRGGGGAVCGCQGGAAASACQPPFVPCCVSRSPIAPARPHTHHPSTHTPMHPHLPTHPHPRAPTHLRVYKLVPLQHLAQPPPLVPRPALGVWPAEGQQVVVVCGGVGCVRVCGGGGQAVGEAESGEEARCPLHRSTSPPVLPTAAARYSQVSCGLL